MSALLALLLQAAAPATEPEPAWQSLGVHGGIDTAFDPASVRAEGSRVRVRIRGRLPTAGADGMRIVTGTLAIDCAGGTATAIEVKGYDLEGRLMLNALVPAAEQRAEPIRPDSPNAAVRAQVCGRQGQ
ncbi:MAG TPA: surface-adhesin E family protein [Allosphingosinicella sp.]|nr:surface-adhesin E family protein [Allosphingosinicella sp.]